MANKRENEDRVECVGVSIEGDLDRGVSKAGGEVKSKELGEELPSS